jgi:TIR domain
MPDVFVSYAHVDNDPDPGVPEGWVTTLVNVLRKRLAQRLGRAESFQLWKDEALRGNAPFSDDIMAAIQSSATLLVILSKGYLLSPWCARELEVFRTAVTGKLDADKRIFVIERDKVARTERPAAFAGVLGYCFWEDGKGKAPRTFGDPQPDPLRDRDYYEMLNQLSYELAGQIERLRPKDPAVMAPKSSPPPPSSPPLATVFLAEVTDDLKKRRDSVKQYLSQAGLRVLPEGWYPRGTDAFRDASTRDIAEAKLFVQLLSELAGTRTPDLPTGYNGLQYELAQKAGKPIFQWRPVLDVAEIDEEDHRRLLEGATVYVEGIEEFKARVVREATAKPKEPPEPDQRGQDDVFVFVNAESADRALAQAVSDSLNRLGIENDLPLWDGVSDQDFRKDLESKLQVCDAFLLIYGAGNNPVWVRAQLDESRRARATRKKPFQVIGIYEGPPEAKPPLNVNLRNARVINCRTRHDEGVLKDYIAALRGGGRP